ncbi:MAG: NAD-dependent epimerase/dehydratase family protein [Bacteroidales bacterium]|nr:NAD-dependent epimerase/dehydratase family protein [Bacteroidales bacterium]MBQ2502260.1 NAD-dependent epimerase/dehydratase family protein [Bacteroidales bacterium]
MKKALFIGGTGTISTAITQRIASMPGWELYLINRGNRSRVIPPNVKLILADINDEEDVRLKLEGLQFDCVCDFIGFVPSQVERDYRLFKDITKQYMYISSASAYEKPVSNYIITEETPLVNPYWQYSRDKIACEAFLMEKYRNEGFPVTIIRPTYTYDERSVPLSVMGNSGSWQVLDRMLQGKQVIIHGDGTSLWTMTHNSDFAKGFTGLMANEKAIGQAIQITSDETLTWTQIYQCVADALGVELRPYYISSYFLADIAPEYDFKGGLLGDKACSVVFDNSKLKSLVPDFKPEVPFAQGIKRTVDYIHEHPQLKRPDPQFDAWCDNIIKKLESLK